MGLSILSQYWVFEPGDVAVMADALGVEAGDLVDVFKRYDVEMSQDEGDA